MGEALNPMSLAAASSDVRRFARHQAAEFVRPASGVPAVLLAHTSTVLPNRRMSG